MTEALACLMAVFIIMACRRCRCSNLTSLTWKQHGEAADTRGAAGIYPPRACRIQPSTRATHPRFVPVSSWGP